ncbi:MAG TPA: D-alanyl-D-alanine carboxypeptidase/D-alanyl-D-alanine-endopeptidase [Bryobacteraceae bacterium]
MLVRVAALILASLALPAADLTHRIDEAVDQSPLARRSFLGIHVVDLRSGKTLYARNPDRLFLPASNMKLFTSALALEKLGPDYRFVAHLIREAGGNLALVGSGDPSLNGRIYPYNRDAAPGPPLAAIEELVDQAVANGLKRVDGDVVGDDRLYAWESYPPSWTQDDSLHESGAPVSALSVADNFVTIAIRPGAQPGDLASLTLDPPLEYFEIDNRVRTNAGSGVSAIRVQRRPGTRQILLSGTISAPVREQVAVDDPALYAACALYDSLTRRGVAITGRPMARHRPVDEPYEPPAGETLAARTSPPLAQLLETMDKVSENLHAELLLREAGRVLEGSGSLQAGLKALSEFIGDKEELRADDGSGLSRNDLVTPKLITRLLALMYASSHRDVWMAMLPVGANDGTLARRLCCGPQARLIHAKTGTLARSIALSGYAESRTHGWLAFSILVNNFAGTGSEVQAWVDKIALTLTE